MKSEGQIRQKLKQVVFRHRKEFVRDGLEKRPHNCTHNRSVRLPVYTGNRATIRVCALRKESGETHDFVCDSTMAGDKQAEQCPYFKCSNTAPGLKSSFRSKLGLDGSDVNIGIIAKEYPDVAALMWVLGPSSQVAEESTKASQENILAFFGNEIEPDPLPERPLEDPDV